MNADEAEKCLEKGMQHFKNGDYLNVTYRFFIYQIFEFKY